MPPATLWVLSPQSLVSSGTRSTSTYFPNNLLFTADSRPRPTATSHTPYTWRTSKSVSEEAATVFYSETTFHYVFNCQVWEHGVLPSPTLRRRMSNVEATIPCGYQHHLQYLGWFFYGLCAAGGESPLKNTLRIAFANAPRDMPRIGYSGLFEYLEYLRSFRKVIIEVTWMTCFSDESARIIHEISDADKERLGKFLGIVLEQIERKIAKVLKAGGKSDIGPRTGLVYARRMICHPR